MCPTQSFSSFVHHHHHLSLSFSAACFILLFLSSPPPLFPLPVRHICCLLSFIHFFSLCAPLSVTPSLAVWSSMKLKRSKLLFNQRLFGEVLWWQKRSIPSTLPICVHVCTLQYDYEYEWKVVIKEKIFWLFLDFLFFFCSCACVW